jgi:DNA modification methylase
MGGIEMIDIRQCDNLELMKEIPDNTIDLIYCDILYGTGRNFGDYQDLKCDRKVIEEHYTPRLKEMHRILKDTGSIYLQMDTRINHWMRCLMDDIFGYENFRNEIIWCYSGLSSLKTAYIRQHDNILFYSKSKKYIFNYEDIRVPRVRNLDKYSGKGLSKYSTELSEDKLIEKNNKGKIPRDWWCDFARVPQIHSERLGYATQKPKALLERIIKASSNEGDLVGDFYLGSGVTAEVCKDLNRNFIGCDISEKAVRIAKERCHLPLP